MATELKWREPPAIKRPGRSRLVSADVVDQLKERPGQWAVIATVPPEQVGSYKGSAKSLDKHIEVISRKSEDEDGKVDVYIRYTE